MGILNLFKKQIVSVIDWTEASNGVLAYRFPMADREMQTGSQLTVRETQLAIFVNEGKVADVFEPGLHTLSTQNLPVLTALNNWDKGFASPFKSDVYFFSTREQIDQKWGTQQPVTIRDKEFGPIRIRAHGTYSYKIKNPKVFFEKLSGSRELYTVEDLVGQLLSVIITNMAQFLGTSQVAFLDMAASQLKFSETLKGALAPAFTDYGLELRGFFVQSLSLPEELQSHLDKASSMRIVGDLAKYAQFQAADSISIAAGNQGGGAGVGMGMGAGMALGQTMSGALGGGGAAGGSSEDVTGQITKLHELLKSGALTQAEFDAKKAELLKKIT